MIDTYGHIQSDVTIPNLCRHPKVRNLSESCPRRASCGTVTSTFLHWAATMIPSIVSVLPVPVGITIIDLSLRLYLLDRNACIAETCGSRNPGSLVSLSSCKKVNLPLHDFTICSGVAWLFISGCTSHSLISKSFRAKDAEFIW